MKKLSPLIIIGLLTFQACKGSSKAPDNSEIRSSLSEKYFHTSESIDVEVWYQANAEPYSKTSALDRNIWEIHHANLTAIFQYRSAPPALTVPSTLAEMHPLAEPAQTDWTSEQILALSAKYKAGAPAANTATFYIYFLDGLYNDGQESQPGVLGVSLGGTNVIAMFKPVIRSTSTGGLELVPKYVEQSTLVHEMGHALGFVDNGVPLTSRYKDAEHGAHSSNTECVMYWMNEGASEMKAFVQKIIQEQSLVLWGPEVLADAKAFSK